MQRIGVPVRTSLAKGISVSVCLAAAVSCWASGDVGWLGQSAGLSETPVPWTGCETCANDAKGDVYLSDGYVIRKGQHRPERLARTVPGVIVSDGRDLYAFRPSAGELRRVRNRADGLEDGGRFCSFGVPYCRFGLAPVGTRKGFAERVKVVCLDAEARTVLGWDADGRALGIVFDYRDRLNGRSDIACGVGILSGSGDLLIGTGHRPEARIFRFLADGSEVTSGSWPCVGVGYRFVFSGGKTWAIGLDALELGDVPGRGLNFGVKSYVAQGVARGTGGWWLGTTQGAQFYPDAHAHSGGLPTRRIGGLADVSAVALEKGMVYVLSGRYVHALWLDDRQDEPFVSDRSWTESRFPTMTRALTAEADGWLIRWDPGRKGIERRRVE